MHKLHFLVNNHERICQQPADELEEVVERTVRELELKKDSERK